MHGVGAVDPEVALLKALAEPTRLRLATLLALRGETCVCELAAALDAPEFRVSRSLGIMKDRGLVTARRQGTWMHYRLAEPRGRLEECLQQCFRDCLADHPVVVADLQRLQAFRGRVCGPPGAGADPGSGVPENKARVRRPAGARNVTGQWRPAEPDQRRGPGCATTDTAAVPERSNMGLG